jgi:proline iminopeptidase
MLGTSRSQEDDCLGYAPRAETRKMSYLRISLMVLLGAVVAQARGAEQVPAATADAGRHGSGAYVSVNGRRIWYESEGEGHPLVLVAGGPGRSHDYLHPWFSSLARNRRVIYFDAFGAGRSERAKSAHDYTFDREVDDLEALRKALGFARIDLLGHSYGGMVAQAYALRHPRSVSHLVLVSTMFDAEAWQIGNEVLNADIRNQFPEKWEKIAAVRRRGLRGASKEHQEAYDVPLGLSWFYDPSKEETLPKDPAAWNLEVYFSIAGDDADFLVGGDVSRLDFRAKLKTLEMPVLVAAGRWDRAVPPRVSRQFREHAPQAQFVMFERSGHFIFVEEPARFLEVVQGFLADGKR